MLVDFTKVLTTNLVTSGTLVLGQVDQFRFASDGHKLLYQDTLYYSPEDFIITVDGTGDATLTWVDAATLLAGNTIRVGVAMVDAIVDGAVGGAGGGGGGGGDASASNQATQITQLGATNETAPASDVAASGLNGRLQRIAQRISALLTVLPDSLGRKPAASSLAVVLSDEDKATLDVIAAGGGGGGGGDASSANQATQITQLGAVTEAVPGTDTASSGLNGRLQRLAQHLTTLLGRVPASLGTKADAASFPVTLSTENQALFTGFANTTNQNTANTRLGDVTETPPGTDTASSGLNGRLQRIAQRITTLMTLLPASLGAKTGAGSLSVVRATDDVILPLVGAVNETAPATDTASAGLNGRMQRVAQRVTSLLAILNQLPATLGRKAEAASLAVALSTEDKARLDLLSSSGDIQTVATEIGIPTETVPLTDTASSGLNGRLQRIAQRISSLLAVLPVSLGRKAETASLAVVLSTEDKTVLDTIATNTAGGGGGGGGDASAANQVTGNTRLGDLVETAPASDTASSGLNGRLQRIAQRITTLMTLFPATLGSKTAANSFAVTASTEDVAQIGALTEVAPATDTASSGLNGRLQRIAQRITSMMAQLPATLGAKTAANSLAITTATDDVTIPLFGIVTETAPASDTASSGLNGRLQRIAQNITAMSAKLPTTLGTKTAANSMSVTTASDDALVALQGAVTETAPATDTASSGLNGRLQRVAQRITTLLSVLPASLGAKAAAASLAVTQSTEDAAQMGSLTETAPATDTASSGLNGRLQRVAQRITTLIAALPASLGSKADASSLAVTWATEDKARIGAVSDTAYTGTGDKGMIGILKGVYAALVDPAPVAVYSPMYFVDVTLSLSTSIYAAGDLLADTQAIASMTGINDRPAILQSITVLDEDDQGGTAAWDLYMLDANVTFGTENSAPSITDTNGRSILGIVTFAAADWRDLGAFKFQHKSGIGIVCKPATGTTTGYFAIVLTAGTPTHTASGVRLRFGFVG